MPLVDNAVGAFGSFGALSATSPLPALLGVLGWREGFGVLVAVTLALARAVYAVVPERREALGVALALQAVAFASMIRPRGTAG